MIHACSIIHEYFTPFYLSEIILWAFVCMYVYVWPCVCIYAETRSSLSSSVTTHFFLGGGGGDTAFLIEPEFG